MAVAFVRGLTSDLEAVIAGLTLHWSSGGTEGAVTRVKKIKRQLYGRAGFELLRKLVLLQCPSATAPQDLCQSPNGNVLAIRRSSSIAKQ